MITKDFLIITISSSEGSRSYKFLPPIRFFTLRTVGVLILLLFLAVSFILFVINNSKSAIESDTQQEPVPDIALDIAMHHVEAQVIDPENESEISSTLESLEAMTGCAPLQKKDVDMKSTTRLQRIKDCLEKTRLLLDGIPSISPLSEVPKIRSGFGMRNHPLRDKQLFHKGIDMVAHEGTAIHSTASGVVVETRDYGVHGYGKEITVRSHQGFSTRYAHVSSFSVAVGDTVMKGQMLGLSGSTGAVTGPHLHYEVLYNGNMLDPADFIDLSPNKFYTFINQAGGVPWGYLKVVYVKMLQKRTSASYRQIASSLAH